jgi:phospholipid/cholesterol/gamma-HCH transport system ATP-binding protein
MAVAIKIVDLKKRFGNKWITKGVNLEIPEGLMTVIVGRSGEGKSLLLKQIIGLQPPTSGSVHIAGIDVINASKSDSDRIFKACGYVFQFAALLDSLTVYENVGITLIEHGLPKEQILPIVKQKLALVGLKENILYAYPSELSGGMAKRVGLARTLVTEPKIILYDEPTTGLDPISVRVIHELMFDMQQRLKLTSVVISHDVEIFNYADKVALLHDGRIEFFGDAKTIWTSDNPYMYQFIRGLKDGPIQTN